MYYLLLLFLCITLLWYLPSLLQKSSQMQVYDGGNAHACIDDGTISSWTKLMTRLRDFLSVKHRFHHSDGSCAN